jgi:hypothetical protein
MQIHLLVYPIGNLIAVQVMLQQRQEHQPVASSLERWFSKKLVSGESGEKLSCGEDGDSFIVA